MFNFIELLDKLPELKPIKDVTNDTELGEYVKNEILGDTTGLEHLTKFIDTKKLGENKRLKDDLIYDDTQCLCTKKMEQYIEYFKGKTTCDHGIKILMTNKAGTKNVWVNPYNLLQDDPLKSDELLRATSSLGLQLPEEIRVKHIECKALGFKQSFPISKNLSSQDYENIATLSGILVSLEKDGNTNLFKEFLNTQNVKNISEIIGFHDKFINNFNINLIPREITIYIGEDEFFNKFNIENKEDGDLISSAIDCESLRKELYIKDGYKEMADGMVSNEVLSSTYDLPKHNQKNLAK